jgi:hypothetical protein
MHPGRVVSIPGTVVDPPRILMPVRVTLPLDNATQGAISVHR